ncbi:MAG: hypothetical protein Q9181_006886 [Wetmoreana brouardii]
MDNLIQQARASGVDVREDEKTINKAHILAWLRPGPVIRAWKDAACDGGIYCGDKILPADFAGRYFNVDSNDKSFVPFSIITMHKNTYNSFQGHCTVRFEAEVPLDQQSFSQVFFVYCAGDVDVAVVPSIYLSFFGATTWSEEHVCQTGTFLASPPTLNRFKVPFDSLAATANKIRACAMDRIRIFTFNHSNVAISNWNIWTSLPGSILSSTGTEASGLQFVYDALRRQAHNISVDLLEYEPIIEGFTLQLQSRASGIVQHKFDQFRVEGDKLKHTNCFLDPKALPTVVSHLKYSRFLFTQTTGQQPNIAYLIPAQFIPLLWLRSGASTVSISLRTVRAFRMELDNTAVWTKRFYDIACEYMLGQANRKRGDE